MFTSGAAVSWETASSPLPSEKKGSDFCDQVLRVFTSSVAGKMLLSIRVHVKKKNSHSHDFLFSKSVFTRAY